MVMYAGPFEGPVVSPTSPAKLELGCVWPPLGPSVAEPLPSQSVALPKRVLPKSL